MAHESGAHRGLQQKFENVCLTGTVCVGAFFVGITLSAIIFAKAFWLH